MEQEVLSIRKSGSYSGNLYRGGSEKLLRGKGHSDRHTFSIINQLVSGHANLNVYKSKLDKKESPLCIKCQLPEDVEHYMFHCYRYDEERKELEHSVEDILCREGINSVGVISF